MMKLSIVQNNNSFNVVSTLKTGRNVTKTLTLSRYANPRAARKGAKRLINSARLLSAVAVNTAPNRRGGVKGLVSFRNGTTLTVGTYARPDIARRGVTRWLTALSTATLA